MGKKVEVRLKEFKSINKYLFLEKTFSEKSKIFVEIPKKK